MLQDVQAYIKAHGTVSTHDLTLKFRMDNQALKPMLQKLSQKGRIHQLPTAEKCHGCTSCNSADLEFYEWVKGSAFHG